MAKKNEAFWTQIATTLLSLDSFYVNKGLDLNLQLQLATHIPWYNNVLEKLMNQTKFDRKTID